jgi:hypothetical protein
VEQAGKPVAERGARCKIEGYLKDYFCKNAFVIG